MSRRALNTDLRSLRLDKGLTLRELGAKFEISESAMSMIELGKRTPNPRLAARIARFYGMRASEIWQQEPERATA